MKKTSTFLILIVCFFHAQSQIDSVNSPSVWLRADKSEVVARSWKDVSIYLNHADAPSLQETPSPGGTINFNNALVFDGIDDYLRIPYSLESPPNLSVLVVFQSADTTERGIWGSEEGSRNILLTTRQAIGPDTIADLYGKSEKLTVLNSVIQNWEKTSSITSSGFMALGSAGKSKTYQPFKGILAELIVFNRSLMFLERIKFETYLAIKYGTGLKAGNFVSSAENVLWRIEENKEYGRNIAGIGRDDEFQLYQKQSGSAYDSGLLIMNAGILSKSNEANTATIEDRNFILWGDNGLPLTTKRGEGIDSVLALVQRKWLVTATGQTANTIPLEVRIDAAKLPSDPLGYWLVVDRSAKGNFSVDHLEYFLPDRVSDGKIIYKDVIWDSDGSGKDHFGFARAHDLLAVIRKVSDPSCADISAGQVRIELVGGTAPFQYTLTSADAGISREWRQSQQQAAEIKDLTAGNYKLDVVDNDHEVSTRRFVMSMPDVLVVDLGPDQTLDKTSDLPQIPLDASKAIPDSVAVTYRWENNFGFNSTDTKIQVSEAGIYRVYVTNQEDGCVFSDEITISGGEQQRIAVYPNILSVHDNYNVSVSLEEEGAVSVKVFNSLGIQVHGIEARNRSEYQFSASFRDTGMFLIVIRTPKGTEMRKIIVQ